MKIFFDNCTSPALADSLAGFIRHRGHEAHHIKDLPCGRDASDIDWMRFLASDGPDWIVVTGDGRIIKNRGERAAFRSADLRGFVLAPAYQKTPLNQQASFLLWRWPDIEQLMSIVGGVALYELPMSRTSKIKSLPL